MKKKNSESLIFVVQIKPYKFRSLKYKTDF